MYDKKRKEYTRITPEHIQTVFNLVCCGDTVAKACKQVGISDSGFHNHVSKDPDLSSRYESVRVLQVDYHLEKLERLERAVLDGTLSAEVFRSVSRNMIWRLGKLHPALGRKKYIEYRGSADVATIIKSSRHGTN